MIISYTFSGEEERNRYGRYIIPRDATHVSVHRSVTVIPEDLFSEHPNIIELICHDGVERIEVRAFYNCPSLRRVIIRGVKIVEYGAFYNCEALEYVECPKLELIGGSAFRYCRSLRNIGLPSVKIVGACAFHRCEALMEAKFSKELESLGEAAFFHCSSLERITIPLKNGLFTYYDDTFIECANLKRVDLVEEAVLHDTVAALLLEDWRNDMNAAIDSINHILPNARAGEYCYDDHDDGEKAMVIRQWIARVLDEIMDYKAKHCHLLSEAASVLQLAIPNDIVMNHVVSFLELPLHTFDGEDENDEEESINSSDDDSEYTSDEDEDRDGEEEDVSVDGEADKEQQQHDGDECGRKRRKTTSNGNEESDG